MKTIVVATDMSARADRALERAVRLASEQGASLEVLHIIDEDLPEAIAQAAEEKARLTLERQLGALAGSASVRINVRVLRGVDFRDIAGLADRHAADLLVLGIPRHDGPHLFKGTTSERIIRFGHRPVLVVKDVVAGPYRRAMVAVDLSPHSDAVLDVVARLVPGGEVYLVHVAHRPFSAFLGKDTQDHLVAGQREIVSSHLKRRTAELGSGLGKSAPRFEVVHCEGDVRQVIREQVAALRPDLLAIGTHGRTGLAHAIVGSIAEDLLASAPVDVLTTKALPPKPA